VAHKDGDADLKQQGLTQNRKSLVVQSRKMKSAA
jgi:hypothetical protein